jgi:hypothetical protein
MSICLALASVPAFASNVGRVVVRENVTSTKREELSNNLRLITGWANLHFDEEGILQLGAEDTHSGSPSARNLLTQAVNGSKFIVLEDASSRSDVAFCRVVPARWLSEGGARLPAFVVLVDFADFRQILGDDEARAAFNVGWGVLHELDHVVVDSKDADEQGNPGECESHINAMRREVGLPLRVDYFFTESTLKSSPNFNNKFVRLAFENYDSARRKRRYWLVWDATAVGGLVVNSQTAATRGIPTRRN